MSLPTPTLTAAEERALERRARAAKLLIRHNPGLSEGERLALLASVVWPEDPQLRFPRRFPQAA
jgi:hypothetical protein